MLQIGCLAAQWKPISDLVYYQRSTARDNSVIERKYNTPVNRKAISLNEHSMAGRTSDESYSDDNEEENPPIKKTITAPKSTTITTTPMKIVDNPNAFTKKIVDNKSKAQRVTSESRNEKKTQHNTKTEGSTNAITRDANGQKSKFSSNVKYPIAMLNGNLSRKFLNESGNEEMAEYIGKTQTSTNQSFNGLNNQRLDIIDDGFLAGMTDYYHDEAATTESTFTDYYHDELVTTESTFTETTASTAATTASMFTETAASEAATTASSFTETSALEVTSMNDPSTKVGGSSSKSLNGETEATILPEFAFVMHIVDGKSRLRRCRIGRRKKW